MLHDNFFFCTLDDPTTLPLIHRIGIDNVMMEIDYPRSDSTWPHTQDLIRRCLIEADYLSTDDVLKITCANAARVFRHPLPGDHK